LFDGNMSATVVRKAKINYLKIIWMEKARGHTWFELEKFVVERERFDGGLGKFLKGLCCS
jgi:hypothetical protein